jgi:hypothetical protein
MSKKNEKKVVAKTDAQVFNLMARGATFTTAIKEALVESSARLKSTPGVMYGSLASNTKLVIPIPDFSFAYIMNSKSLLSGRMMCILGADGIGKTSLVYTFFGWWIPYNMPCCIVETEGKPMDADRIRRCLHSDRQIADQMFNTISFLQSFEIVDAVDQIENWLMKIRDKEYPDSYVPDHIPAAIALDTYSKLMAPAEAVGYHVYEEPVEDKKTEKSKESAKERNKENKKKILELGGGSNFGHAKMAHAWSRRLPSLLTKYNAFLIIVRHQNDKVDMAQQSFHGGGGSFVAPDIKEQWNRTSIGGRAFAQSAAYEILVTRDGKFEIATIRGENTKVSQPAKISVTKTSYGPGSRSCHYTLTWVPRNDTETYQEPTIDFSGSLPDILKQTGLMRMDIKNKGDVSCKELGLENVSPRQLAESLHKNTAVFNDLCVRLGLVASGPMFKAPTINPIFSPVGEPGQAPPAPVDDAKAAS